MKKTIFVSSILTLICIFVCSCTSNYAKDVHFIHAVFLDADTEKSNYEIVTVCEKQSPDMNNSKKEEQFFVCSENAESFEKALEKLTKKYSGSYYASSTLYFLNDNTDKKTLNEIAVFIAKSNILPSKAQSVLISNTKPKDFLETIKSQEDIKKILKLTGNSKTNIINFLADYTSLSNQQKVPRLTLSQNKKNIILYQNE